MLQEAVVLDDLYSGADLPPGFSLPKSFLVLMAQDPIPDFEPWWFLNEVPDEPRYWLHRFKSESGARGRVRLIGSPFGECQKFGWHAERQPDAVHGTVEFGAGFMHALGVHEEDYRVSMPSADRHSRLFV